MAKKLPLSIDKCINNKARGKNWREDGIKLNKMSLLLDLGERERGPRARENCGIDIQINLLTQCIS